MFFFFRFVVGTRSEVFSWHPEECKEVLLTHNEKISKHVEKAQPETHMPKETHGRAHMQTSADPPDGGLVGES